MRTLLIIGLLLPTFGSCALRSSDRNVGSQPPGSTESVTSRTSKAQIKQASGGEFGDCSRPIRTEWLDDGRKMRLLEQFVYKENNGTLWVAPKGAIIDGASIPRFAWSLIGGPFEGKYRKASVVHDVACDEKTQDWRTVHRMFYPASRCGGVGLLKAKIMFAAVYHFGPRWGIGADIRVFASEESPEAERQFRQIAAYLQEYPNVPIERIETLTPEELQRYDTREIDLREPN